MKVRNNFVFFFYCDCLMNDVFMKYLGNIKINLLNIVIWLYIIFWLIYDFIYLFNKYMYVNRGIENLLNVVYVYLFKIYIYVFRCMKYE